MARKPARVSVVQPIVISNSITVFLYGVRVLVTHNLTYWYLVWNLFLGWLPLLFAFMLMRELKKRPWKDPICVLWSVLWLGFLPNSFYIISDLIHLQSTADIGMLYDVVLFVSSIWNGLVVGMISVYWVHKALIKYYKKHVNVILTLIWVLVGFAIYLGRSLRWNTWDVLVNPAGLFFDVSERVINPFAHPQLLLTTITFFMILGSMYMVIWSLADQLSHTKRAK